jgi:hypothetical protein
MFDRQKQIDEFGTIAKKLEQSAGAIRQIDSITMNWQGSVSTLRRIRRRLWLKVENLAQLPNWCELLQVPAEMADSQN